MRELAVTSSDLATLQETLRDVTSELASEMTSVHTLNAQLASASVDLADREEDLLLAATRINELERSNVELERRCQVMAKGVGGSSATSTYGHRLSGAAHEEAQRGAEEVSGALRRRAEAAEREVYVLQGTVEGLRKMLVEAWEEEGGDVEAMRGRLEELERSRGVWERETTLERHR